MRWNGSYIAAPTHTHTLTQVQAEPLNPSPDKLLLLVRDRITGASDKP